MSNAPGTSTQAPKPEWKVAPTRSRSFERLNEILEARYMGWVELSTKAKLEYSPRSIAPQDIPAAIGGLEEGECAAALFRACIHGDLEIAKEIWGTRGPFSVDYQKGMSQDLINGEVVFSTVKAKHALTNLRSSSELVELMEWMPSVGMGFMVGIGSQDGLLLQSSKLERPIKHLSWSSSFTGDLPVLSNGALSHPELMLALQAKSSASAYPGIFQEVLCWVDEKVVPEFADHLHAYESMQSLFLDSQDGQEYLEVPIADVTDEIVAGIATNHLENGERVTREAPWKYRSLILETVPAELSDPRNRIVLGYQADEPLKHGFNHKAGHVLCRTTVDFLSQFPVGQVSKENLSKASDFTKDYFPLDLAMLQTPQVHAMHTNCLRTSNGMRHGSHDTLYLIKSFYQAFADSSPIQLHMKKAINESLFGFVKLHHCHVPLDVGSMIGLHQGLGLDNTGFSVDIDYKDLQALKDISYRFSDESRTVASLRKNKEGNPIFNRLVESDTEVKFDVEDSLMEKGSQNQGPRDAEAIANRYTNSVAMNLWPAETPQPASLAEALVMASRKKKWGETPHERSLLAYIDHAGMQACAEVAKTTPHWTFLKDHFGRAAMEPYMGSATRAARGKILMDDLGM